MLLFPNTTAQNQRATAARKKGATSEAAFSEVPLFDERPARFGHRGD
jgi:hypothetical protein